MQTPSGAVRPLRHCVNGGIARIELATATVSGDQPWLRYGVLLLEFPVNGGVTGSDFPACFIKSGYKMCVFSVCQKAS